VLASRTLEENLRQAAGQRAFIDLVELRADHLLPSEAAAAASFPAKVGLPCILTVRRKIDGGVFDGTETERLALLGKLVGAGFAGMDVEEDLQAPDLDAAARAAGVAVIRSFHDFSGVPSDLAQRLERLPRNASEIAKAAVTPRTSAQLADLLAAAAAGGGGRGAPRVILGMGDLGFPTRVLAARLGSAWSYTSPTSQGVAPGQVTPGTLVDLYRFRSLRPDTPVFGVVGNPVMHSRSPLIHNRGYAALGIDAVYLPFQVPDLEAFWATADLLAIRGLSVTVPHKTAVLGPRVSGDEDVRVIGACNTLFRSAAPGPWSGANTDMEGFLSPLREVFDGRLPGGLRAVVIGAGGAARSVVAALTAAGARVLVCNRTVEHARGLAEAFGAEYAGLDADGLRAAGKGADLIVQTTSVGMAPRQDLDPASALRFRGNELIYELIYAPAETPLVRRALAAGCRVVYGWQMLLAQARRQFLLFTGREYPRDLMDALATPSD